MKTKVFSKALLYHLHWKVKLRKFLEGQGSVTGKEDVFPEDCSFGKWLCSHEITTYASGLEIEEIRKVHTELQEIARRIVEQKMLGNDAAARQQLRKMEPTHMKLVSLLTAMKTGNRN